MLSSAAQARGGREGEGAPSRGVDHAARGAATHVPVTRGCACARDEREMYHVPRGGRATWPMGGGGGWWADTQRKCNRTGPFPCRWARQHRSAARGVSGLTGGAHGGATDDGDREAQDDRSTGGWRCVCRVWQQEQPALTTMRLKA
eukprot:3483606-Prymnesium_polylepis.1